MSTPPPTDSEAIAYNNAISEQLENGDKDQFAQDVAQAGVWANEVDASFDKVSREFKDLKDKYGASLPDIITYYNQWVAYNQRWVAQLQKSRDVASKNIALLERFDKVFIDMIMMVETEQDRKDAILELQSFIDEDHSDSTDLYQAFLDLKRDIEDFIVRLYAWIKDKGTELENRAKELREIIDGLKKTLKGGWDKKVNDAEIALAAMLACVNLIGITVAGSILADYKSKRAAIAKNLKNNQDELEDVNRKQQALAHMQTTFDGLKPDFALICDRLGKFAGIWASIRSQSVQFQEYLKGGSNAQTNLRFKSEIRVAKAASDPLQAGLRKYATELENRKPAST